MSYMYKLFHISILALPCIILVMCSHICRMAFCFHAFEVISTNCILMCDKRYKFYFTFTILWFQCLGHEHHQGQTPLSQLVSKQQHLDYWKNLHQIRQLNLKNYEKGNRLGFRFKTNKFHFITINTDWHLAIY